MVAQDKAAQAAVLGKSQPATNLSFPIWFASKEFGANQIGKERRSFLSLTQRGARASLVLTVIFRPFRTSLRARPMIPCLLRRQSKDLRVAPRRLPNRTPHKSQTNRRNPLR
jgi:hypothetical protein